MEKKTSSQVQEGGGKFSYKTNVDPSNSDTSKPAKQNGVTKEQNKKDKEYNEQAQKT